MSIQLQIGIPLLVTFAALLAVVIWRKFFRKEAIITAAAVLMLGVLMTTLHFTSAKATPGGDVALSETDGVSLMLAQQCIVENRYDTALEILNDISRVNGDNTGIQAALARCTLLKGNYTLAVQLYEQLGDAFKKELEYAKALDSSTQINNNSIIAYLNGIGKDASDYDLKKSKTKTAAFEDVEKYIHNKVKSDIEEYKKEYDSDILDAVEIAAAITNGFDNYSKNEQTNMQVEDYDVETLAKHMEKNDYLNKNQYMRIARLKGFVLNGDYGEIAKYADSNVGADELIILTELYLKGLIDKSDFTKNYINLNKEYCETVLENCKEILKESKGRISGEKYSRYKERIENLSKQLKDPALFAIRYNLQWQAASGKEALRSKSYLSLAKLEEHCGNSDMAQSYINEALGTAADSDDENYRIPMTQVSGIIQGTAESEEIKNVTKYVNQALDHSLPVGVEADDIAPQPSEPDTNNGNTTEEKPETEEGFNDYMINTVVESTATINIGVINKDDFPEVKARVQIQSSQWDSPEEIKEHLIVYDCGSQITDFKLEKLEFSRSNIILLCDISGSMSGSIDKLKEAIISFSQDMQEGEEVCVVGFDDYIVFEVPFSDDPDTVASAADKIKSGGGTAIYNSLLYAGNLHNQDVNANNIIIAMTDGQDGGHVGEGEMHNKIGAMVADKNITVYTLGLGSGVDVDYLELIAGFGNGSFLYVDSDERLENFYSFIHGQLNNQYVLTYTARNKTLNERKLELSVEGEMGGAEKIYYLQDKVYTDEGSDSYNPYTVEDTELSVTGLTTKFLYKSSKDQVLELKGNGFDEGDDITIRISDNVKYNIKAEYKDKNTYSVTIPPEVSVGTYDMTVSIRGESVTLNSELTIAVQGNEKNFRFGAYNFTALNSYVNDKGETVLSGNVVMNSWMRFKGDIIVAPYNNNTKVQITDNYGFYVGYSSSTAEGLALKMAENGTALSFGALGSFYIHDAPYTPEEYENFPVEKIYSKLDINFLFFFMEEPCLTIYPDMVRMLTFNIQSFELPLQKQLLRNFKTNDLSGNLDTEVLFNATRIAAVGKVSYNNDKEHDFTMVSFPLQMNKLEVALDTLKGDFSFDMGVKFKALKNSMESIEFGFDVKDGRFDGLNMSVGGPKKTKEITLMKTPVPITFTDFGFEISGLSKEKTDDNVLLRVLDTDITVKFKMNVASLNSYLPGIAEFIDDKKDVALATLKDCKLTANLRNFRFSFDADIVLATVLDFGKCHISLGIFSYTNALIGYYNETQYGLQASLTIGPTIKTTNVTVSATATAELTVGYPYTGAWLNGKADFDIKWWILKADFDVSGDVLLGAYKNSSDNLQFSFIVKGVNTKGNTSGFHLYVTRSAGFNIKSY